MRLGEEFTTSDHHLLKEFANAELTHIRQLGLNQSLAFASSNLSAYEALLTIIQSGETGLPVYQAITNVRTPFSGPAGVMNRLKAMRNLGLLEEKPGIKKSQVCLVPSEQLLRDFYSVLSYRHFGGSPN